MIITTLCFKLYFHFKLIKQINISGGILDWIHGVSRCKICGTVQIVNDAEIHTLLNVHPPHCCLVVSTNPSHTNHKWTQSLWSEDVVFQRRCVSAFVPLHPLSSGRPHPKSCFVFKHRWPPTTVRRGPVDNSSQPGRTLRTCAKRAFSAVKTWLFIGYLSILLLIRWTGSLRATAFSLSVLLLSFLDISGSQRKNSWRRVLTVSGHSIMTMWLPSSITFRKANRRIYK